MEENLLRKETDCSESVVNMEISYGLVNLMYFMLCDELNRIKGSRSNKRRKLLTCFTNSLFKVYNNLSLRETGPEVYNTMYVLFHPYLPK